MDTTMNIALWILACVLGAAFLLAGAMKLLTPYRKLSSNPKMAWALDFSPTQVKLIGLVELLGAVGLVLPPLVDVAEWLVPLAAAGLALTMFGAFSTHVRRDDPRSAKVPNIVLGTMALVLAVGRAWVVPF
jgi:uncharacterized membrane protein YphA (DoxX/SURF4 family)